MKDNIPSKNTISFLVILIAGYCLLAPLDGLITGAIGSVQRYYSYLLIIGFLLFSKGKIRIDKYVKVYIYLLILYYVSLIWSIDRSVSFSRNNAYALLTIVFIIASQCEYNQRERKLVEISILVGSVLMLLYLFTTLDATNFFRGRLLLNEDTDANGFAARMILPSYLFFSLYMRFKGRFVRYVFLGATILFIIIGLLTGSRGFLISMIVSVLVYLSQTPLRRKGWVLIGSGVLLIAIYYVMIRFMPVNIYERLFTVSQYSGHADSQNRIDFWFGAFKILLRDMALFGYGSGNDVYKIWESIGIRTTAHNLYVTMIMEYGILGLPVFIYSIKNMISELIKKREIISVCVLSAMLVTVFFLSSYAKRFFWLVLIYSIMIIRNNENKNENGDDEMRITHEKD